MKNKIFILSIFCLMSFSNSFGQWKKVFDKGKNADVVSPIYVYKSNIIVRTSYGIYLSKDSGNTWKLVDTSNAMQFASQMVSNDSVIYAQAYEYGVYRSRDSGRTWKQAGILPMCIINCIILSGKNILMSADYDHLYLSEDYGNTWKLSGNGLPKTTGHSTGILEAFLNMGNSTLVNYYPDSYITHDHGYNWQHKSNASYIFYKSFVLNKTLYSAGGDYFYTSNDSGVTYKPLFRTKAYLNIVGDFITDSSNILCSVVNEGVRISRDSGKTWVYINNGLSYFYGILDIAIMGKYIYSTNDIGQIFRRRLDEVMTGINKSYSSDELLQLKLYPNPVLNSATFEFGRMLKNGKLQVYSAIGQEVRHIDNINSEKIELNRGDLASGTYIYIISEKGTKLATGKILLK